MTQIQPATGLLLPADANRPVRRIQVRPDNIRDMTKLIGCQCVEFILTPIESVVMIANEEGLLEDKRPNTLASILYSGPIMGDVLLLGLEGPATTSLSEYALGALAQVFDIEPGRSALDVAKKRLAETDGGAA
nr:MAG TPA: protein of unknown function (DUF3846) [Caudoviricetes sp.]